MSSGQYFWILKANAKNYCDCVDYDFFPGAANGYNSNGYTNGLIRATGGSASVNFNNYVGGARPVPANYFAR